MKQKLIFSSVCGILFTLMLTSVSVGNPIIDGENRNTVSNTTIGIRGSFREGKQKYQVFSGCGWTIIYNGQEETSWVLSVQISAGQQMLYEDEAKQMILPGWSVRTRPALEPVEKTSLGFIIITLDDGNYTKITTALIIVIKSHHNLDRLVILINRPVTKIIPNSS